MLCSRLLVSPLETWNKFQSWGDRDETTEHFFPQKKSGGVKFLILNQFLVDIRLGGFRL